MHIGHLEQSLGTTVISKKSLSGGDIANALKVKTHKGDFFVKWADFQNAKALFEQETLGLQKLHDSKSIKVPKIIGNFSFGHISYLILEFINTRTAVADEMELFGRQLALLHRSTITNTFGFEADNFIGKLSQVNSFDDNWSSFYVKRRLDAQLELVES